MDHLLHSISIIIHFKQVSKRAVQTYVEVIPRPLIVYLFESCPLFFRDWDVLFGLFWIGLGIFGNRIGDEDGDEEGIYV
jgi:hypothetical protein